MFRLDASPIILPCLVHWLRLWDLTDVTLAFEDARAHATSTCISCLLAKKAKLKFDRDLNNIELSYWICQVVAWTCQCCYMWFSPFAKHSQSDVWPRYLSFLIGLKHSIKFKDSMPWVSCAFATFLLKTWVYFLIEQISLLSLGSVCFEGFLCSAPLSPLVVFYGEHIVSIQQGLWISICHPQDSLTLPHWHVHRAFIFLHNLLNGTKALLSCILSSFS